MEFLFVFHVSDYELDFGYSVGIHHGETGHSYIHRDGIDVL